MSAYPDTELNKLHSVKEKSQPIGEFIEWLRGEKGVWFGKLHKLKTPK